MKGTFRVLKKEHTMDLLINSNSFFVSMQYILENQFPREQKQHLFLIHNAYSTCWNLIHKSKNKYLGDADAENLVKGFIEMCVIKEFPPDNLVCEVVQFLYKKSNDLSLFEEESYRDFDNIVDHF